MKNNNNSNYDKILLRCPTHPYERLISVCMNPFCETNKLLCNQCISQQLHACKFKQTIPSLFEPIERQRSYSQRQLKSNSIPRRASTQKEKETEVAKARERIEQLENLKKQVVSVIDGIIESNKKTVDDFEKSFTDEKEQIKKGNDSQDQTSSGQTWEGNDMSEEETFQKLNENMARILLEMQDQAVKFAQQLADKKEEDSKINSLPEDILNTINQNNNTILTNNGNELIMVGSSALIQASKDLSSAQLARLKYLEKQQETKSIRLMSIEGNQIDQITTDTCNLLKGLQQTIQEVRKYQTVKLSGIDSCSQPTIDNIRNFLKLPSPINRGVVNVECEVLSVDVSWDYKYLAVACSRPKYTVFLFQINDYSSLSTLSDETQYKTKLLISLPHPAPVNSLVFSPQLASLPVLVTGSDSGAVRLYSVQQILYKNKNNLIQTLIDHTASVTAVAYSRDGRLLFSGSLDCQVLIYECGESATQPRKLHQVRLDAPVLDIQLSNRYLLAVLTENAKVTLIQNTKSSPSVLSAISVASGVKNIKMSQNERYLAVSGSAKGTQIFDLTYSPAIVYDTLPTQNATSMAFHPENNEILAVATSDNSNQTKNSVVVYQLSTNDEPTASKQLFTLVDHIDLVQALRFIRNTVISGSKDKTIRLSQLF